MGRRRHRHEARAILRQQNSEVKSNKVKSSQCDHAQPHCAHLAGGTPTAGGEVGGGAGDVGGKAREVRHLAATLGAALEPRERTCEARRVL